MGILNWLFGISRPIRPKILFGTHVSPSARASSRIEHIDGLPPILPVAPETPWPKWKNGQPYSEADKEWRDLQLSAMKHAMEGDWGMYRNDHLDMALHIRKEGKTKRSLDFLLEVNYLDINGPNNFGFGRNTGFTRKEAAELGIKEWEPSSICASTAPAVVEWTWEDAEACGIDMAALRELFLKVAARHHKSLRLPVTPETAWPKLHDALEAYIAARLAYETAKEARRLERQAERDAKRAEREAAKAMEREQKKAVRVAEMIAKRAEHAASKADVLPDE